MRLGRVGKKPWEQEYFDIRSASHYLKISQDELIRLMCGRRLRKFRDEDEPAFDRGHTQFKWEDIHRLRGELDKQRLIEKAKPQQLDLL